ncbi:hypothetical protein CLV63_11513 [Murinocardiopsis flavida]|uniref:Uncharacterized protein n=1 Tax=Murinocardiopsis flavida TaxID=645275 RepID=A0A2P8DDQ2_9ACTN|nr:hypothetical protein CLV63_11513 [Murinocardiopsis flavida]
MNVADDSTTLSVAEITRVPAARLSGRPTARLSGRPAARVIGGCPLAARRRRARAEMPYPVQAPRIAAIAARCSQQLCHQGAGAEARDRCGCAGGASAESAGASPVATASTHWPTVSA